MSASDRLLTPAAQLDDVSFASPEEPAIGKRTLTDALIQREADGQPRDNAAEAVAQVGGSTGAPLPADLQARFGRSLGADLSDVRVHTGTESATAAAAVAAKAFTVGHDIHFGEGRFDPASSDGQRLLAHEVAHTVQQRGGGARVQHQLEVSQPDDAAEIEAEWAAGDMVAGERVHLSTTASGVHREKLDKVNDSKESENPLAKEGSSDFWTGNLRALWAQKEFRQGNKKGLLHEAVVTVFEEKKVGDNLAAIQENNRQKNAEIRAHNASATVHNLLPFLDEKSRVKLKAEREVPRDVNDLIRKFEETTCNHLANFFIASAKTLDDLNRTHAAPDAIGSLREAVKQLLIDYTLARLSRGKVDVWAAWVNENETEKTVSIDGNVEKKRKNILGQVEAGALFGLVKVHVGGHFHLAEVVGTKLCLYDNQAFLDGGPEGSEWKGARSSEVELTEPIDKKKAPHIHALFSSLTSVAGSKTDEEKEADRLAAEEKAAKKRKVKRSASGGALADNADAAVARAGSSSGAPLPGHLQAQFGRSLGADLSDVRVHTGAESAAAASAVSARAFAVGQDIHFAAGMYDPSSAAGQHLLAHEVAHTVQQQDSTPSLQGKLDVSQPGDAAEVAADHAADAMVQGIFTSLEPTGPALQRFSFGDLLDSGRALVNNVAESGQQALSRGRTMLNNAGQTIRETSQNALAQGQALVNNGLAQGQAFVNSAGETIRETGQNVLDQGQAMLTSAGQTIRETGQNVLDRGEQLISDIASHLPQMHDRLSTLMAQDRLTAEEIAEARELIAQEPPANQPALYTALQEKVRYQNQRRNESRRERAGGGLCNLTSLAMCLEYLGIEIPGSGSLADRLDRRGEEEAARRRIPYDPTNIGNGTSLFGWGDVAKLYGAAPRYLGGGSMPRARWAPVAAALAAGEAVICGSNGHIRRIQGVTDAGVVEDDPYSRTRLGAGASWAPGIILNDGRFGDASGHRENEGEDNVHPWSMVEAHAWGWIFAVHRT